MILVIDFFDSFVETLARYVREADHHVDVVRYDRLNISSHITSQLDAIVLSPGPGRPSDYPKIRTLIDFSSKKPVLGVCLGHQMIVEAYGGATVPSALPVHGEASPVFHNGDALFSGVSNPFLAGRYHSLKGEVQEGSPLKKVAWLEEGGAMAVAHKAFPHVGLQFHPESILTPSGRTVIENFLKITKGRQEL